MSQLQEGNGDGAGGNARDSMDSFATAKSTNTPSRRMTADFGELEGLMNGLKEEQEASAKKGVSFAASPAADDSNTSTSSSNLSSRRGTPHSKTGVESARVESPALSPVNTADATINDDADMDDLPAMGGSPMPSHSKNTKNGNGSRSMSMSGVGMAGQPKSILHKESCAKRKSRMSLPASKNNGEEMGGAADGSTGNGNGNSTNNGNTKKRSRRSVAFGSPQAAEFNTSSPSTKLTPMPSPSAKHLYRVPDTSVDSSNCSRNDVSDGGDTMECDDTVELEDDVNALMTSINNGHGTENSDDDNTIELEGDLSELLKSADDSAIGKQLEDEGGGDEDGNADADADGVLHGVEGMEGMEEEDNTVELEGDMSELLGMVNDGKSPAKTIRDKVLSPDAVSMVIGAERNANGYDSVLPGVSADSGVNNYPVSPAGPKPLTLTSCEILSFAEKNVLKSFKTLVHNVPSVLLESCNKASVVTPIYTDSINGTKVDVSRRAVTDVIVEILDMAVDEVSAKVANTVNGGEVAMGVIKSKNPELVREIQGYVRSRRDDDSFFQRNVEKLFLAVQENVTVEWNKWENAVTSSMLAGLNEEREGILSEEDKFGEMRALLEREICRVCEEKDAASMDKKRKSMEKREALMNDLNSEIAAMEQEAALLTQELEGVTVECDSAHNLVSLITKHADAKVKTDKLKKSAKNKEKKFKMLEGLLLWSPVHVDGSKIIVNFNGVLAETAASVGFDLTNTKGIAGFMMSKPSKVANPTTAKKAARRHTYSRDSRDYARKKMDNLRSFVNDELVVKSGGQISEILQSIEWQIGRIETVAQEISALQKHHDSLMEIDDDGNFLFTIDFTSKSQTAKLRMCFDLGGVGEHEYPLAPMRAHAETKIGSVDATHLKSMLNRSVKPGFGYLTRACDVVTAYMK
jgi:hypothetical protein